MDGLSGEEDWPLGELAVVAAKVAVADADGAEGAQVGGEDAGDGGDVAGVAAREEVVVLEDERCGAPNVVPAGGEHGGAGGILGGNAGHDILEKVVMKGADAVFMATLGAGGGEEGVLGPGDGLASGKPSQDVQDDDRTAWVLVGMGGVVGNGVKVRRMWSEGAAYVEWRACPRNQMLDVAQERASLPARFPTSPRDRFDKRTCPRKTSSRSYRRRR